MHHLGVETDGLLLELFRPNPVRFASCCAAACSASHNGRTVTPGRTGGALNADADPFGPLRIENGIHGHSVVTLHRSARMNNRRLLLVTLMTVSTVAVSAEGLDVKTGLWEMTYTSDIQGSFLPQATLDKMTPAQKAQLAAAAKKQAAQGPRTWQEKTCVTARGHAVKRAAPERCADRGKTRSGERPQGRRVSRVRRSRRSRLQVHCEDPDAHATGRLDGV